MDEIGKGKRQVWAILLMVPGPDRKLGQEVGKRIRVMLDRDYPELSERLAGEIYWPGNGSVDDF